MDIINQIREWAHTHSVELALVYTGFWVLVLIVVVGLVGLGIYHFS